MPTPISLSGRSVQKVRKKSIPGYTPGMQNRLPVASTPLLPGPRVTTAFTTTAPSSPLPLTHKLKAGSSQLPQLAPSTYSETRRVTHSDLFTLGSENTEPKEHCFLPPLADLESQRPGLSDLLLARGKRLFHTRGQASC